jgi:hypothetical protein
MQPASVPHPKDDAKARPHLIANLEAAEAGALHPGDWRVHTLFLVDAPGDFTPVRPPDYAEIHEGPLGQPLGYLGEYLPGWSPLAAQPGLEAGQ